MAVDKAQCAVLIAEIDKLLTGISDLLSPSATEWVKNLVVGPALEEIRKLIEESRHPRLFLVGQSGHGKSSLINALAGRKVAETNDVEPETTGAKIYFVEFPEKYSSWEIIDSRGFFEIKTPDVINNKDPLAQICEEISEYKPDVLLHVLATTEIRSSQPDLEAIKKVRRISERAGGSELPLICVLSKPDLVGKPSEWPPESHIGKSNQLERSLDLFIKGSGYKGGMEFIDKRQHCRGYYFPSAEAEIVGVLPVHTLEGEPSWNIENLTDIIGNKLPESAKLEFFQALGRKDQLRKLSESVVTRFSTIAGFVGASPVPLSDIIILTPLQLAMVAVIAGLSCRPFSINSAKEFLGAGGVAVGAGFGLRTVAQVACKFAPIAGNAIGGGIAYTGTMALGKAAQKYFFR